MQPQHQFHGANAGYVLDLYDRFLQAPASVDEKTREFFAEWVPPEEHLTHERDLPLEPIVGAVNLAQAIREHGHLNARLDPLGSPPPGDPSLDARAHGL